MPTQGSCIGGFGEMGNYMMGGNGAMFVGMILFVGVLLYLFSRENQNDSNQIFHLSNNDALVVLKKRFANSEISEEEYLAKKDTLTK